MSGRTSGPTLLAGRAVVTLASTTGANSCPCTPAMNRTGCLGTLGSSANVHAQPRQPGIRIVSGVDTLFSQRYATALLLLEYPHTPQAHAFARPPVGTVQGCECGMNFHTF